MNLLDLIAPATAARRRSRQEAAAFAASVRPGHTYYSVCDLHGKHAGAHQKGLMTWTFGPKKSWITGEYMSRGGHLSASGAWLGFGPLLTDRPPGILTFPEMKEFHMGSPEIEVFIKQYAKRHGVA